MRNTIYYKWFMDSLTNQQKTEYRDMSINQQKDWYISYLEDNYKSKSNKTTRGDALEWWNLLFFEEKFYKTITWLKENGKDTGERHPNHLTGREIEEIYKLHKNKL